MDGAKAVVLPSVSFSLAAIVRTRSNDVDDGSATKTPSTRQQYVLVHEKSPRGWWLPGGGVESHDETPVAAAVRETLEEAGSAGVASRVDGSDALRMTHLLSLEQTAGRIRFIFRGEWRDDGHVGGGGSDDETTSVLKKLPGDSESQEAQWVTFEQVRCLSQKQERDQKRGYRWWCHKDGEEDTASISSMTEPWLRGHEPLTFFGILERAHKDGGTSPGVPLRMVHPGEQNISDANRGECTGAFFRRDMPSVGGSSLDKMMTVPLGGRGRAIVYLQLYSHLLVYDTNRHLVAVDVNTNKFPMGLVKNQKFITLKSLVHAMISDFTKQQTDDNDGKDRKNQPCNDNLAAAAASMFGDSFEHHDRTQYSKGILRMEHIMHGHSTMATLSVYPYICISHPSTPKKRGSGTVRWIPANDLIDDTERGLANALLSCREKNGTTTENLRGNEELFWSLDILKDTEDGASLPPSLNVSSKRRK